MNEGRQGSPKPVPAGHRGDSENSDRLPAALADPSDLAERLTPVLELVPEPRRQEAREVVERISTSFLFQGPMPPPGMLRGYDEVVPGAAERILALTEREQAHRHHWERQALSADQMYAMTGLVAGWTTAVLLAVTAAVTGIYGHWAVGTALAAASATGMVAKLVQGRREEKEDEAVKPPSPNSSKRRSKGRGK